MANRNAQLKSALGAMAPKARVIEANSLPKENTVNRQGHAAYALPDELRLVTLLNTLKLQPQFYRSENEQMRELRTLIEKLAIKDPLFVAKAIVWSRCKGEGMRSVNHLAAALLAPFISGEEYAKRFYGAWDKKNGKGGCIFRMDDMVEIKEVYAALNNAVLSNSMKKGFASVLEKADTYSLAKYSKVAIDIANLVHPKSKLSEAMVEVEVDGLKVKMKTLDALMRGLNVAADTWEVAQSEAGQEVAKAVREGKISKVEAEKVLTEAKADNWEALLKDGKLGIMAALRNIRNIMKAPRKDTIEAWCKLITDPEKIRKGLLLPVHFDLAYDVVMLEFANADYSPKVQQALLDGYQAAIPNLKEALPGKTCIFIDCSGSMGGTVVTKEGDRSYSYNRAGRNDRKSTASYKAGLIAATIAKATGADVVKFGGKAYRFPYNQNENVFALAQKFGTATDGWTNPAAAFDLISHEKAAYDRIIFISDNEVNGRLTSASYKKYIHDVCSPYIYGVDLCGYGTTAILNADKVSYLFGYGPTLYNMIATQEFNPEKYIEEIRAIEI